MTTEWKFLTHEERVTMSKEAAGRYGDCLTTALHAINRAIIECDDMIPGVSGVARRDAEKVRDQLADLLGLD